MVRARKAVISAAGVEVTYRKLLDEITVQKLGGPPKSLLSTEKKGTTHHMYAFIGLEGTQDELKLPTYNTWGFPLADVEESWNVLFGGQEPSGYAPPPDFLEKSDPASADLPCFISFPSAKDPLYNERNPGKSAALLISEARAEFFGLAGSVNDRGAEYAEKKEKYKQAMMATFYRYYPHLKSKVSYVDIATPWSNEHYLGRYSSYGLDADAARFMDTSLNIQVQGVRNLYLTGQDILMVGIFTQPMAAFLTLSKVLGLTSPDFWLLFCDFAWSVSKRKLFSKKKINVS